ncbi:hypothetical protein D0Z00_000194 [Geotrichum galactomycetum]|uniref:Uncharacterized protein n=1 Tax=Geotrichum galactomycetum TaxID=27317 RepID=A0ACB6VAD4_9ASCO|nr:hypothetical protein D0Z00_000194 [Geotrichum candidum]
MMASEAYAMIQETIEKTYSKEHELFYNSPITPPGTILGLHSTTGTNSQILCDPASGLLTITDASSTLPSPPAAAAKSFKPAGSDPTRNNSVSSNSTASTNNNNSNNNNGRRRDYVSWSKRETEGLVRWLVAQDNFLAMKRNTAQMLPKLSQHLQLHVTGCCKTAKQCDHKIRNLKKCYKKVKDKLSRLGIVDSVNAELEQEILDQFPYFREFEKIMSDESSYLKPLPPSILTPPKSEEFDFNDMSKFHLMPTLKDEDHESINTPDTAGTSPYYNSINNNTTDSSAYASPSTKKRKITHISPSLIEDSNPHTNLLNILQVMSSNSGSDAVTDNTTTACILADHIKTALAKKEATNRQKLYLDHLQSQIQRHTLRVQMLYNNGQVSRAEQIMDKIDDLEQELHDALSRPLEYFYVN